MKKALIIIWLGIFGIPVLAQDTISEKFVVPLTKPGEKGFLQISQINGDIIVEGYAGKEVVVEAFGKPLSEVSKETGQNPPPPGMKRITANPFELEASEENNVVEVNTGSWKMRTDLRIKVPVLFDLELHTVHGNIKVTNVTGVHEVSGVNGSITLDKISGAVVSNTVNGRITVRLTGTTGDQPMSFVTLNGDVEVTLPANVKATAKMRSEMGEIYSDFDMALEESKPEVKKEDGTYHVSVESWVLGKINGGGPEYTFKNMHGNIIVRKGG